MRLLGSHRSAAAAADVAAVLGVGALRVLHRPRDCSHNKSLHQEKDFTRNDLTGRGYLCLMTTSATIPRHCQWMQKKGGRAESSLTAMALLLQPCCEAASFRLWLHEQPYWVKDRPSMQHLHPTPHSLVGQAALHHTLPNAKPSPTQRCPAIPSLPMVGQQVCANNSALRPFIKPKVLQPSFGGTLVQTPVGAVPVPFWVAPANRLTCR